MVHTENMHLNEQAGTQNTSYLSQLTYRNKYYIRDANRAAERNVHDCVALAMWQCISWDF